jgi:hypothetical protein
VFFNLTFTNQSLGHYWGERWELYKLFYSQTLWSYQRNVTCATCPEEPAAHGCQQSSDETWALSSL